MNSLRLSGFCLLTLVLLLAVAAPAPAAGKNENDRAREAWMVGYIKLEEAMKAENRNNQVMALQLYREALEIFNQVKTKFPNWNSSLLDYRSNYCTERIRRLESSVAALNNTLSKEDLLALSRSQEAKLKTTAEENQDLKRKFEMTGQALERARAEAASVVSTKTDLDKLVQENKALKESLLAAAGREKQLRTETETLKSHAGLKTKAEQLQQELNVTMTKKQELEKSAESFQSALRNMKEQLKAATLERERLALENKNLKEASGQGQQAIAGLTEKVQDLEKQTRDQDQQIATLKLTMTQAENKITDSALLVKRQEGEIAQLRNFRDQYLKSAAENQDLMNQLAEANKLQPVLKLREQELAQARTNLATLDENAKKLAARTLAETQGRLPTQAGEEDALETEPGKTAAQPPAQQEQNVTELKRQLQVAETERQAREEALSSARAKLTDLAKIETLLKTKEDELLQTQTQFDAATRTLNETQTQLETVRRQADDRKNDNDRLTRMLDTLQQRDQETARELEEVRAAKNRTGTDTVTLREKFDAAAKQLADLETNRKDLLRQQTESRQLIRRQEEHLAELEKTLAAQKTDLTAKDQALTELNQKFRLVSDKASVIDGVKDTLTQAETTAAAATTQLASLEVRLREKDEELKRLNADLTTERQKKIPGTDPLTEELRRLNRDLDREREKTKALEQAMTSPEKSVLPAAQPAPGKDEAVRRSEERELMVRGFLQQATAAEKAGKSEAALWNYRKALEYQPDSKLALKRLGLIASGTGNLEEAEGYLRKAFYADPDDLDVLSALGFILVRAAKPDLAISMLSRAVALKPDDPAVHRVFGIACSSLGWTDAAEVQFRRALDLDNKDGEAAFNLAILLVSRKPPRSEEAKTWYQRAQELGLPPDPGMDKLLK